MMLTRINQFVSHEDSEILDYFHVKMAVLSADPYAVIEALDHWWFVPRSEEMLRASQNRVSCAYVQWSETGKLPEEYEQAYRFARAQKYAALEASYRAYKIGGWGQWFKVRLFLGLESMIPEPITTA